MQNKILLEYVWLDGNTTQTLRSKVKTVDWMDKPQIKPENLPTWNFDGSSTNQAAGNYSECNLKPVRVYHWTDDHYFVLCEVMNPDGTPHTTNQRALLTPVASKYAENNYWWGFEQEFFLTKNDTIAGFPTIGFPPPQGPYYCGVGAGQVVGRNLSEAHLKLCLRLGIDLTGTNAEVAIGQWEYQCFSFDTMKACDDLWMSRYLLHRLGEDFGFGINLEPKPVQGDWNGSGCHTNFSNNTIRNNNSSSKTLNLMNTFEKNHNEHITAYGENNDQRLTGDHETQHIDTFSWGVGDRGSSIRVPVATKENGFNGYFEDRRPASNCDPYKVAKAIIETVEEATEIYYSRA
tara:strand:+ start:196 stop:1236 length:1041 start_codon:yes stop_codon:yes gene_type:complete